MPDYNNMKAIFSSLDGKMGFFILQQNTLVRASFQMDDRLSVGSIVMGHLEHKVENLDAAFVEYQKGTKGFLKKCGNHKGNDLFPVQITKHPVKTKDAELNLDFEMKGLYAVLKKKPGGLFLSQKISKEKADDMKAYLKDIIRDEYSIVVRSNAISLYPDDLTLLKQDILALYESMDDVLKKAESRSQFTVLYNGCDFVINQLSELDFQIVDEFITDDVDCYKKIKSVLPSSMVNRVRFYDDKLPISALYGIKGKLSDAIQKRIWLKSGGYLIVEPTEAMFVIDVNSGKNTSKVSKDKMIDVTNREACETIANLISLLNVSGMILIDFINYPSKSREDKEYKLLHYMKELTRDDVMEVKVFDFTALGIMELTRAKKEMTLIEQLKEVELYEAIKSL